MPTCPGFGFFLWGRHSYSPTTFQQTGWQTEGGDRERAGEKRGGEAQVDVGGRAHQEDWEGERSLGGGDHDDEDDDVIGA